MEKYCTITIFVWLGLPLFCRSLIFLESDESLNIDSDDRISVILQNRDYPLPAQISTGDYESITDRSLNIEEKYSGKDDDIVLTSSEHNNDYHDYPLSQISTNSHKSIKSRSLNIDGKFDGKEGETILSDFENNNDYHDYPSSLQIRANSHESIKSRSLNNDEKPDGKEGETVLTGSEYHNDYHDYPLPSQIRANSHESLNIDEKSTGKDDEVILQHFENNNDYHDYPLSSQISSNSHKSIKSRSLHINEKSDDKEGETVLSDFEDNHDYTLSSQIRANSHESLSIDEKSAGNDDEVISPHFDNNNDYHDYPLENLVAGDGHEMVESDPVVEEIPEDIELVYQMNKKRHVPDRGFTEETRKLMLDLHNVYRGNVTPPAGDMNVLVWDESLEQLAQLWADNCVFAHGRPPSTSYYFDGKVKPYGQNLYLGTDPSGYKGLWMWYEEYMHYELRNQTCKPNEQCGHYVQMAWAESKRLGCGIKLCGMRYLIVCHYYPGALKDVQMYRVGRPCSLCDEEEGALCKDKLCVSHELCKENSKFCESATCNLKCQNCGRLNKTSCHCTCADGWDSPDCSKPCADDHERCGRKPGFPHKASCSIQNYAVAKKYCRKMCDTCVSVTNDTTVNHLCCDGRLCQKGYVLDLERKPCRCTLLCPGPLCDYMDDNSSALNYSLTYLISQILVIYFINHSRHSL